MRASYEDQFFHAPIDVSKCRVSNFDKYLFVFAIIHMQVVLPIVICLDPFRYIFIIFYSKNCRKSSFHLMNIFFSLFFIYHKYNLFYMYLCFHFKCQVSNFNRPISKYQFSWHEVVESERSKGRGQHKKQAANKDLCVRAQPMGRAKVTYKEEKSAIVRHHIIYT